MKNLKDNIWIEGFVKKIDLSLRSDIYFEDTHDVIYQGKTSEIPEEIARECVKNFGITLFYYDYRDLMYQKFETAKESIQSACDKPYCIIYKR